ncbi:KTSC domain-containing protein [Salisediminibacterium halotolerans]|uniref:KTSC domain-containing protein n=1 Tax=Salisediminibacterium halotolerans TaxID=517425 RepID=A0A1H9WTP6_9BACI|nr:KTSC domain-containing protein [Salisediminibacterium haloalkalitolerans]SES37139.1 KTSC domain-containing protein [Salisediminibacterium haloalkalitolerans]
METTTVNDGYFESIGFEETGKKLHVRFSDGRYIVYYEVNNFEYVGLISANDMREYYETTIAKQHPHRVMRE